MEKPKRRWATVEFVAPAEHEDLASWLTIQCGAAGCEILPGEPGTVVVRATFDKPELTDVEVASLRDSFEMYGIGSCLKTFRFQTVTESDWLSEWKKGFEPFAVGESFMVSPPWSVDAVKSAGLGERRLIIIEPAMAFGTGLHATTRYCLSALDCFPIGEDVLDVGTGSGILAIGAALLYPGVAITAVDTDPVAIESAAENLRLNNVADRIGLVVGSTETLESQAYDTILSNLTCEDILALLIEYLRLLRPGGHVICAGILREKLPLIEERIESYPLSIIDRELGEMWAGITLARVPVQMRAN